MTRRSLVRSFVRSQFGSHVDEQFFYFILFYFFFTRVYLSRPRDIHTSQTFTFFFFLNETYLHNPDLTTKDPLPRIPHPPTKENGVREGCILSIARRPASVSRLLVCPAELWPTPLICILKRERKKKALDIKSPTLLRWLSSSLPLMTRVQRPAVPSPEPPYK